MDHAIGDRIGPLRNSRIKPKEKPALDFADCWLAAQAAAKMLTVASFDRDLDKFKDITRYEPEE